MSGRVRVTRARARREREAVRDTSDESRTRSALRGFFDFVSI